MSDKKACGDTLCRKNTVGGQAVLEGIMMKSKDKYSIAVRKEDGSIDVSVHEFHSVRKKHKFLNIPILRGVVNFVETMMLSFKTLSISAEALGLEEEESKFEKWLKKTFGKSIIDVVMVISGILGVALAMGLFVFLPILVTRGVEYLAGGELGWLKNLIEGFLKIFIFVVYIWAVSFMKDIRRTFEYHGAEHKSIFCYESGDELTVDNVKKYKRFHPRCGTSFIFVVLIISILVYSLPFVTWDNMLLRTLTKLLLLPLVVGTSYEFIMWAGKHDGNTVAKVLSFPGLLMQRITTREPDASQIEVAIAAIKRALPEEFGEETKAKALPEESAETEAEALSEEADKSESSSAEEEVAGGSDK